MHRGRTAYAIYGEKPLIIKERWQGKASGLIDLLGQPGESPLPLVRDEKCTLGGPRQPNASDLCWMYWVLGETLETVFGMRGVLISRKVEKRLSSQFPESAKAIYDEVWWNISVEDCRTYWSFVSADLPTGDDGELNSGAAGSDDNETDKGIINNRVRYDEKTPGFIENKEAINLAHTIANENAGIDSDIIDNLKRIDPQNFKKLLRSPHGGRVYTLCPGPL